MPVSTAIPIERFFTRANTPEALIRELKAKEKAAGRDPKLLQIAVGKSRVPLATIEKDLGAMWRDRFDPGPLGRGASFRPQFERDFRDASVMKLSTTSAQRLGRLSDDAVRELRFTDPSRLATLQPARTEPGLVLFLARSVELQTANASWAAPALTAYFQQPLDLVELKLGRPVENELGAAWLRAARALDLDASKIGVRVTGKTLVPLSVLNNWLTRTAREKAAADSVRSRLVHDPSLPWDLPGAPDAGPMPFNYATAPGYGGGTTLYFPEPPAPARQPKPGSRLADPPPDVRLPPRLAPAPPPSTGGVVFTPPPPPPPATGRPLISTPWEIIATPGASEFFQAKAKGWDGSWEDWKAR
jgi:hypothetical protein